MSDEEEDVDARFQGIRGGMRPLALWLSNILGLRETQIPGQRRYCKVSGLLGPIYAILRNGL